jgi:hypothetical protein
LDQILKVKDRESVCLLIKDRPSICLVADVRFLTGGSKAVMRNTTQKLNQLLAR